MFNTIIALLIAGAISASGANHLLELEKASKNTVTTYVKSAEARFKQYEAMLPGIVEWQQ